MTTIEARQYENGPTTNDWTLFTETDKKIIIRLYFKGFSGRLIGLALNRTNINSVNRQITTLKKAGRIPQYIDRRKEGWRSA